MRNVRTGKLYSLIKGHLLHNAVYCYYGRYPNFGDQLTPELLKYYGYTPVYSHYSPQIPGIPKANFLGAGTLLQNTPKDFSGVILGTGADDVKLEFPSARILAVRGNLTRNNLAAANTAGLGDPGLLMSLIYPERVIKKYKLGIVPHLVDRRSPIIMKWRERLADNVTIIDPCNSPGKVIRQLKECEAILSSSLHGIIIADAFRIPAGRFVDRKTMIQIHDFKYIDYYSSLNEEHVAMENPNGLESCDELRQYCRTAPNEVKNLQTQLNDNFRVLRTILF